MMRFFSVFSVAAISSCLAALFMPWWGCMLLSFVIVLLLPLKRGRAFLATALGTAVAYTAMSIHTDIANDHILSSRMAVLFHLPSYSLMILLTAVAGAVTSGLGGWTAAAMLLLFKKKNIQSSPPN